MKRTPHPLRRVVADIEKSLIFGRVVHELLECGHDLTPKSDAFGRTHPVRRRCRKCPAAPEKGDQR